MLWLRDAVVFLVCWSAIGQGSTEDWKLDTKIGGLFEYGRDDLIHTFHYAINKVNEQRDLLQEYSLSPYIQKVVEDDSFHAQELVCHQFQNGVAALFGPVSEETFNHVMQICHKMEIPHIMFKPINSEDYPIHMTHSINLYPDQHYLGRATLDFIKLYNWDKFTLLFQDNAGLLSRLTHLIESPDHKMQVSVLKLENVAGSYAPLLKKLQEIGVSQMIIDCHYSQVKDFLTQAIELHMVGIYYHYHFTTLDISLVELDVVRGTGTNVTAYRIIDLDQPVIKKVTSDLILQKISSLKPNETLKYDNLLLKTDEALLYDAVHLYAGGLQQVPQPVTTESLSCDHLDTWTYGSSIVNYVRLSKTKGLTGYISLDSLGKRTNFTLQFVQVNNTGIEAIGFWNDQSDRNGLVITKDYSKIKKERADTLKNKTLRVVTIKEDPYVMIRDDPEGKLTGNDRFQGFCVDLLDLIAKEENFSYVLHLVKDGQYGAEKSKGVWTGMVKELIDRDADIAFAPLTISYAREQVIDFTKPFMNLGISILFKKPKSKDPKLFQFLNPLSLAIWLYMMAAYTVVSLMLFILARFTPYEDPSSRDQDRNPEQLTLVNSFWFTIGTLMMQGSDLAPKAMSTRVLGSIWYLFALILVSSYTANLAAFLTSTRLQPVIKGAEDLVKQTEIHYGAIEGGSTMSFFNNSHYKIYERMWNFMSLAEPSVFVKKTEEGIQRVRDGNYAYLLESVMNEYITQRNCDLMQVGGLLDDKGYGIGTPRGSPYRDILSDTILKLSEEQKIYKLYEYWWKVHGINKSCESSDKNENADSLSIANVGGVFVVLAVGILLSIIVAIFEFIYKAYNPDKDEEEEEGEKEDGETEQETTALDRMAEQLRYALRCLPPKKKRQSDDAADVEEITDTNIDLDKVEPTSDKNDNVQA